MKASPNASDSRRDGPLLVQTARPAAALSDPCWPAAICEYGLYDRLRAAVPILDAAISKIVRLTGGYKIRCENPAVQPLLDRFVEEVPVGLTGHSLHSFTDHYLDSLLTYGNAVGEILFDQDTLQIAGLYHGSAADLAVAEGATPLTPVYFRRDDPKRTPLPHPERILFSALNPPSGQPYGISVLHGLPALSGILLRIYECIGQNYERAGNVRYAVTYKPAGEADRTYAADRAREIAREWSDGMAAGRCGEIRDFVAVGDVDIKVIGAENPMLDTEIPVRQLLEQLIAKLSVPPFLLGLSWSTTERMSAQQADILTSELEYYRRLLTPVIRRIAQLWLAAAGLCTTISVEWDNINLQDETALADARLKHAQAREIELRNLKEEQAHV